MFKHISLAMMAVAALFLSSCSTKDVEHTGDKSGTLYGTWVLDTKTTTVEGSQPVETSFVNDHFYLTFTEPRLAYGQEGSIFTFDIDDVDAVPFSFNEDTYQITFEKRITLSTGFPPRIMDLFGTFSVLELTKERLALSRTAESALTGKQTTTAFSYHRLIQEKDGSK